MARAARSRTSLRRVDPARELRALRHWFGLALADCAFWVLALLGAVFLRYDFHLVVVSVPRLIVLVTLTIGTQLLGGIALGLYTGRCRLGSFEEAYAVALVTAATALVTTAADLALDHAVPVSATLAAASPAFVAAAGLRYLLRLRTEPRSVSPGEGSSRVILFGAGSGSASVIAAMLHDEEARYVPVALLDDEPTKRRLRIYGVPVHGGRQQLAEVAQKLAADSLLIAIPSADQDLIRDLAQRGEAAGLTVRVLPRVSELFDGVVGVEDIRPVSYADLLGRREVDIDIDSIADYLTDKRVLVTGAGGSIGSELCRQLQRFAPAALVLLDRDESALHTVQLSMQGRALLDSPDLVVADIRDRQRLRTVFAEHRPEVVFHAAALKHLPLLEMAPDEAVKTNVFGTWNVLEAAGAVGVRRFVNISTDKAADPCSMLGYSKRIAEMLTSWFSTHIDGACLSVRFGNVLGSRGSVVTAFETQIAMGGPVTVTDPDVTRYFMTVEEAVRLVIQAGAVGRPGEALVLDMGEPVRIADVAQRLIADSGRDTEIVYTGLRPGEKMHEVLLAEGEPDVRPVHDRISHVPVPRLAPLTLRRLDPRLPQDTLRDLCRRLSGAPRPNADTPTSSALTGHVPMIDLPARPAVVAQRRGSDPAWPA